MNKKQYNNVIDWTLKHDKVAQTEDSLATARAVFNNMGVALPNGSMQEVYDTIKTNKYMGWRACTMQEAQEAANKGTAAIGINKDRMVILSAADEEEPVTETASVMSISEKTSAVAVTNLEYYAYSCGTTTENYLYPYVDIPQDGNIGTAISYMGYHCITDPSSNQYKLREHARNNGRYSISYPEYYAQVDGRIVIATKQNIGSQLLLSIGDYVQVCFRSSNGHLYNYDCIIGDFKGSDASNIWGHYDGQGVVEIVYHDYNPPSGYNQNKSNPWGTGRVIRVTKVGQYGSYD